jgi:hypothetical protein
MLSSFRSDSRGLAAFKLRRAEGGSDRGLSLIIGLRPQPLLSSRLPPRQTWRSSCSKAPAAKDLFATSSTTRPARPRSASGHRFSMGRPSSHEKSSTGKPAGHSEVSPAPDTRQWTVSRAGDCRGDARSLERQLSPGPPGVYEAVISGHRESPPVQRIRHSDAPEATGGDSSRQLPITHNEGVPGSSPGVG